MLMSFALFWLTIIFVGLMIVLSINEETREHKSREHVRGAYVEFKVSPGMFPEHWTAPPINANAESLPDHEQKRTKEILEVAAGKYPGDFYFPLNVIFVLRRLTFYGVRYGGTYAAPLRNYVYITNDGFSNDFIERLFHAELSSVLHKLNPNFLNEALWKQQLPPDFTYTHPNETDVALTQLGEQHERFEPELLELGFLTLYATTNLENDFNSIVKQLFVPDPDLWHVIETYPRIRTKVDLTINFYNSLNSLFTRDHFRAFELKSP